MSLCNPGSNFTSLLAVRGVSQKSGGLQNGSCQMSCLKERLHFQGVRWHHSVSPPLFKEPFFHLKVCWFWESTRHPPGWLFQERPPDEQLSYSGSACSGLRF